VQGGCFVWGSNTNTQMAKGGDDSDNLQPKRIGRTARFRPELQVVQVAFGSQVGGRGMHANYQRARLRLCGAAVW
jgi:hypothetical protein